MACHMFGSLAATAAAVACAAAAPAASCQGALCQAPRSSHSILMQINSAGQLRAAKTRRSSPRVMATCPATADGQSFGSVQTSQIDECSGLAASRKNPSMYWVNNDSGAGPTLYAIDRFGKHLARLQVSGSTANDWEDIAVGPGPQEGVSYIYIADTGDNHRARSTVSMYRIEEPQVPEGQDRNDDIFVTAKEFVIQYPDGEHDCEAMFIDQGSMATAKGTAGRVYIITKGDNSNSDPRWAGGDVYYVDLPAEPTGILTFQPTSVHIPVEWVTGADITPTGSLIVLRSYGEVLMWPREESQSVEESMGSSGCSVSSANETQGEAVAFGADSDHYVTVSEGSYPAVWYFGLPKKYHQALKASMFNAVTA